MIPKIYIMREKYFFKYKISTFMYVERIRKFKKNYVVNLRFIQ